MNRGGKRQETWRQDDEQALTRRLQWTRARVPLLSLVPVQRFVPVVTLVAGVKGGHAPLKRGVIRMDAMRRRCRRRAADHVGRRCRRCARRVHQDNKGNAVDDLSE